MEYEQEALNLIARRRRGKQTTRHSCSTFSFSFFFFFIFFSLLFFFFFFFFFFTSFPFLFLIFYFSFFFLSFFLESIVSIIHRTLLDANGRMVDLGMVRDPSRICIILSVRKHFCREHTVESYHLALLLISKKIFWRVYRFVIYQRNI